MCLPICIVYGNLKGYNLGLKEIPNMFPKSMIYRNKIVALSLATKGRYLLVRDELLNNSKLDNSNQSIYSQPQLHT